MRQQTIINRVTDKLFSIYHPVRVIALAMLCCVSFAATADASQKILLAQNTVTTNGVSTAAETPRVISRPQPAVVPTTDQSGLQTDNSAEDTAPTWQKYLSDYLSDEQLALLQDNLVWILVAAGALLLLPMILLSIISSRRNDRHRYESYAPSAHDNIDNSQPAMKLGELDFDELDLTPANTSTTTDKNHQSTTRQDEQEAAQSPSPKAPEVEQLIPDTNDDTLLLNPLESIDEKTGSEATASDKTAYPETLEVNTPAPEEHADQNQYASSKAEQASAEPSVRKMAV